MLYEGHHCIPVINLQVSTDEAKMMEFKFTVEKLPTGYKVKFSAKLLKSTLRHAHPFLNVNRALECELSEKLT